jgi:uncharacterized integral membrane protein
MEALSSACRRVWFASITGIAVWTSGLPAILIIFAAVLDGAFVIRIPANTATCLVAEALAVLFVAPSTCCG